MKKALRGRLVSYRDDPFVSAKEDYLVYEEDGLVTIENGHITAVGAASALLPTLGSDTAVTHYQDALILPGFIDCHVHYPQTEIIGAYGTQLIDWLEKYTFVAEQSFADAGHASRSATIFLRELLRAGTKPPPFSVLLTLSPSMLSLRRPKNSTCAIWRARC